MGQVLDDGRADKAASEARIERASRDVTSSRDDLNEMYARNRALLREANASENEPSVGDVHVGTFHGEAYIVSNTTGRIVSPGPFEGEREDVPALWHREHDDFFVFNDEYVCKIGERYFTQDTQGFITEIRVEDYATMERFA